MVLKHFKTQPGKWLRLLERSTWKPEAFSSVFISSETLGKEKKKKDMLLRGTTENLTHGDSEWFAWRIPISLRRPHTVLGTLDRHSRQCRNIIRMVVSICPLELKTVLCWFLAHISDGQTLDKDFISQFPFLSDGVCQGVRWYCVKY